MPPSPTDAAAPYLWAQELLECACAALTTHATAGCPERACVYNGGVEVAFDDCCAGHLWVSWGRTYPTNSFPEEIRDQRLRNCWAQGTTLAIDFEVGIVRCAPTIHEDGTMPTCDEIAASALQMHEEAYILLRAVTCCLDEWNRAGWHAIWNSQVPAGDEGTCVGSVLRLTVGIGHCTCLPDPDPSP